MLLLCYVFRILLFYIVIQTKAWAQICVETKMGYQDVPETFLYTYLEAYKKTDCLFWCTGTRVATAMGTRTVQKLVPERVNVCCKGYIKDESFNENSIHCKPDCSPACVNGYCKSPGECACNPGYLPDVNDAHNCSPMCIKGCEHGTCTTPNTCLCDSGYNLVNEVCEPICSEPCLNATCVAPETCQCHPGYKKSVNDSCEPFCSGYTAIEECIISITCELGWTNVIKGSIEICEPACSKSCANGTCIAPEICECLNGYEKSANDICEPYCFGCEHGSCISPQTCVCDPGWYRKDSNGTCLAHCDHTCGNGTCVAPNICECYPGFELDKSDFLEDKNTALCVPICNNCEGFCVAPDVCMCEPHQEMTRVNAGGGPCDCEDNCSDARNICEKTICMVASTTASVTIYEIDEATVDTTASNVIQITSDVLLEDDNTVKSGHSDHIEMTIEEALSWYNSDWRYAMGSIFIFIIIILIAVAIVKRKHFESLRRNIFRKNISENDVSTIAVHYKHDTA